MEDLLDRYHRHLIRAGLASSTIRTYRGKVARWRDWATDNGEDPTDIGNEIAVRRWSTTLPATESTRQQAIAAIMHLADMLNVERKVAGDAVERPRRSKPKNWRGLSVGVEAKLTAAAQQAGDAGTAVLIALWSGLRRSEIAGLSWEDVDLTTGRYGLLLAYRAKVDDWHSVPLDPRLRSRLEPRHQGTGWVLPGTCGGHVSAGTINKWVADVARQAGVGHITPHQLRYTCATRLYEATSDLAAAKELLGHVRVSTTVDYLRLSWRLVEEAMRRMHDEDDDDDGLGGVPVAA